MDNSPCKMYPHPKVARPYRFQVVISRQCGPRVGLPQLKAHMNLWYALGHTLFYTFGDNWYLSFRHLLVTIQCL
jgi:hypothetical protein